MKNNLLKKQINLPLHTRIAPLDAKTETSDKSNYEIFDVVFATGAKIRRCDIFESEYYDEELVIERDAIRLERLNSGAPVLDTHEQNSISNVIGVVVTGTVRIENGEARASIKLDSKNTDIIRKIKDGIIKNVSVGYVVHKFEVTENEDVAVYKALDWEPYEISLVPIGADVKAGIRSNINTWPCTLIRSSNFLTQLRKL